MNAYGYVAAYQCCNSIELAFYTTVLRLDKEKFEHLYQQLSDMYTGSDTDSDLHVKRLGIQVDTNTRMVFTIGELGQLVGLMEEAKLILSAYEIIES